ncbi:unnamed protein product [Mucor hiemalis]
MGRRMDEITPSQLFENLENIENMKGLDKNKPKYDYGNIDSNDSFPLKSPKDAFSIFLDELITIPIKTQLKTTKTKQPFSDISNKRKVLPPPAKDKINTEKIKQPTTKRVIQ